VILGEAGLQDHIEDARSRSDALDTTADAQDDWDESRKYLTERLDELESRLNPDEVPHGFLAQLRKTILVDFKGVWRIGSPGAPRGAVGRARRRTPHCGGGGAGRAPLE
jgi:hypothetical protein